MIRPGALRVAVGIFATCALVAALMILVLAGCGETPSPQVVLDIDEALAAEDGLTIKVQGYLVATEAKTVLASALMESYPPQAGGSMILVEDLDPTSLVGLSSTATRSDLAQVTWSDYWVVLEGILKGGALEVRAVPRAAEAVTDKVRVRFSTPIEPLVAGDTVWWVFDVTNLTERSLDLTFSSGQRGEVVLSQGGVEKYRWSSGRVFTQAIGVDPLAPGVVAPYFFSDTLAVSPGEYDLTATVEAVAGAGGAGEALPEVVTRVTVR